MFNILKERLHQKHRTLNYPDVAPVLPPRYCGRPVLAPGTCPDICTKCITACPTQALSKMPPDHAQNTGQIQLDMGRCIFCAACRDACPQQRIAFSTEHRLAARRRQALLLRSQSTPLTQSWQGEKDVALARQAQEEAMAKLAQPLRDLRLFARSFRLRQVSAGGCNACEADCNVLTTLVFDLGRFGIDFVASPRHADALVVTGPVSENMRAALWDSYEALPAPRAVIAVGSCAISGGLFAHSAECHDGIPPNLPVDCHIPGCPPHPWSILDGLLLCLT